MRGWISASSHHKYINESHPDMHYSQIVNNEEYQQKGFAGKQSLIILSIFQEKTTLVGWSFLTLYFKLESRTDKKAA
jgi:hypothetical protein